MDILESREASLRFTLFGSSASPPSSSALFERLCSLQTQLDQLTAAVSGSIKLRELYQETSSQLQLPFASTYAHSSSRAGDELRRAAILSSADRLEQISAELQQLQQLTSILDQLKAPDVQQQEQLIQMEAKSDLQSERALALHSRVEKMLTMYQHMVLVLSEKCVECNALLDQLHEKGKRTLGIWVKEERSPLASGCRQK